MMENLEGLLGDNSPSPNEAVDENAVMEETTPPETAAAEGLDLSGKKLEVAGVVTDEYGNTWQVPADNVEDLNDLYAGNTYKLPEKLTSKFHVQLIPISRLQEYVARKFVPVKLEEVGIPKEFAPTTGKPLDSYHVVGDSILVKIPLEVFERLNARKIKEAKDRLAQLEPTKEMMERTANSGIITRVEREQSINYYRDPSQRPGLGIGGGK